MEQIDKCIVLADLLVQELNNLKEGQGKEPRALEATMQELAAVEMELDQAIRDSAGAIDAAKNAYSNAVSVVQRLRNIKEKLRNGKSVL